MPTLDELDDHQPAPYAHTGRRPETVVQEGAGGQLVTLVDEYGSGWMTARELVEVEQ